MLKVQLIVVQGKPEGKTIPLTGSVFCIGRDESCQLRPSSEEVSRRHAEFAVTADSVTVRDLGSRNGTFLNGRAVTELSKLKSGDLVKVGPLTFAVSIQGAVAAAVGAGAGSGAAAKSLDEVSAQEVDAWLVADNQHEVPDRPSGVFDGDTVMMGTYEGGTEAAKTEAKTEAPPAPKAKPAATAPAPAAPPPPPAPAPAPVPAPAQPAAEDSDAIPLDDTPIPANPAASKPAASKPAPVAPRSGVGTPPKSIWDELDNMEYLPEGEGDVTQEGYSDSSDFNSGDESEEGGEAGSSAAAEEWIDESNPFYAAKKKAAEEAAAAGKDAKPSFKDSSEAANAILRKILDRKKSGG